MKNNYDRFLKPVDHLFLKKHRQWLIPKAQGKTLELAIGTGLNLPYYQPEVDLTGIDISQEMIDITRSKAQEMSRDVHLVLGDVEKLPFEDETFDTVLSTFLLCGVNDVEKSIDEALRVLKPNGIFLMANHIRSTNRPTRILQLLLDKVTVESHNEHWTRDPLKQLEPKVIIKEIKRDTLDILESVYAIKP